MIHKINLDSSRARFIALLLAPVIFSLDWNYEKYFDIIDKIEKNFPSW